MGGDSPHRSRPRAHHERLGLDPAGGHAHAAEQRATRDPRRGDEDVLSAHEIVVGQHLLDVEAGLDERLALGVVTGPEPPWSAPPWHLIAAAEMTLSGVPPMPISTSTPVPGCAAAIAGATSPSRMR